LTANQGILTMTDVRPGVVQRAYEIAKDGHALYLAEIESQLDREGYMDAAAQMRAPALKVDLRKLCNTARKTRRPEGTAVA
jgi:hypothetical protein